MRLRNPAAQAEVLDAAGEALETLAGNPGLAAEAEHLEIMASQETLLEQAQFTSRRFAISRARTLGEVYAAAGITLEVRTG